jgi:hypothetical protein
MGALPADVMNSISVFATLFTDSAWRHVQVLLGGAMVGVRTGA